MHGKTLQLLKEVSHRDPHKPIISRQNRLEFIHKNSTERNTLPAVRGKLSLSRARARETGWKGFAGASGGKEEQMTEDGSESRSEQTQSSFDCLKKTSREHSFCEGANSPPPSTNSRPLSFTLMSLLHCESRLSKRFPPSPSHPVPPDTGRGESVHSCVLEQESVDHSPELHTSEGCAAHTTHFQGNRKKKSSQHGDLELPKFGEGECKHGGGIWRESVLKGGGRGTHWTNCNLQLEPESTEAGSRRKGKMRRWSDRSS